MSKVSANTKLEILRQIKSYKASGKYYSISELASNLDGYMYVNSTIRKGISELLQEGKLTYMKGRIFVVEAGSVTPADTSGADSSPVAVPTEKQILEAASSSPEAKAALEKLFPKIFEPKTQLVKFTGGTSEKTVGDAITRSIVSSSTGAGIQLMVAKGMAPKDELQMKTLVIEQNNVNLVVFDENGNEAYRSKPGKRVLFGFEKKM